MQHPTRLLYKIAIGLAFIFVFTGVFLGQTASAQSGMQPVMDATPQPEVTPEVTVDHAQLPALQGPYQGMSLMPCRRSQRDHAYHPLDVGICQ